jgi:hypothetical protein
VVGVELVWAEARNSRGRHDGDEGPCGHTDFTSKNNRTVRTTAAEVATRSSRCISQSYCIDASLYVRGGRAESFAQDLAKPPRGAIMRLQDDGTTSDAPHQEGSKG